MSEARKCDRCGEFYEHGIYQPSIYGYCVCDNSGELDLCEQCRDELDEWMKAKTKEEICQSEK